MKDEVRPILEAFGVRGEVVRALAWGSGHIHATFRVRVAEGGVERSVLLQRINTEVFPDPVGLTASIRRVTGHLEAKRGAREGVESGREVLRLLQTDEGEVCVEDGSGAWWRAYRFVEGARTYDVVRSPEMARRAAYAFGSFQRDLVDLPPPRLPETIPGFHDTRARFEALRRAVEADPVGRVKGAEAEIEAAMAHEEVCGVLAEAQEAGVLAERVTHNDTKVNNVLFDARTGEAVCVIDLDTIMPGVGPYDFGDLVRTTSTRAAEDARDLRRMEADPVLVEALASGYLSGLGEVATEAERELLVPAGEVITLETGIRFLTDFLEGDRYFRTRRPAHNLDRCRAQLALLASLERQRDTLRQRVRAIR